MRLLGSWDLPGHCGPVYALVCDYERNVLYSGGSDGLIAEWRCVSGKQVRAIAHTPAAIYALHWMASHKQLYVGQSNGVVYVLDLAQRKVIRAIQAHQSAVFGLSSHPQQVEGWSSGRDGYFLFWDTARAEPYASIKVTPAGLRGFVLVLREERFLTAGRDGNVYEISRETKSVTRSISVEPHFVFTLQVSPQSAFVATGGRSGMLKIWDIQMQLLWESPAHNLTLTGLAWHPAGRILASGGRDRYIHLWDTYNREKCLTLEGHKRSVNTLLWTTPETLVSAGDDGLIKIWHLEGLPA
ncbi:MAG: WD40 repeat domain-containing protein [Bacteroidia bacterium]|nr:WD40 repeat domain-containing protein [Bacteroidia bacterium]MDW8133485.1 WD40 repeat domain-containing protein [Bacteroidia bacterium]